MFILFLILGGHWPVSSLVISVLVTWEWPLCCLRSFKVTDFDTNRKLIGDFLLVINTNCLLACTSLPSARQHPSYGDCLEVKREYYQNCSVLGCVTQCLQSAAHTYMSSSYRSSRLGLSHWDPYAMRRGGCLELYYCNMVEWPWWDSGLI